MWERCAFNWEGRKGWVGSWMYGVESGKEWVENGERRMWVVGKLIKGGIGGFSEIECEIIWRARG